MQLGMLNTSRQQLLLQPLPALKTAARPPQRRRVVAAAAAACCFGRTAVQLPQQRRRSVATAAASSAGGFGGSSSSGGGAAKRRQQQQQQQQARRRQRQLELQRQRAGAQAGEDEEDDSDDDGDDDDGPELSELRRPQHVWTVPDFAPQLAARLRAAHDGVMADPRRTNEGMFKWHRFHVPQQYSLTRTQASAFFPPELHAELVDALIDWGERELGCRAVSPIWLSSYTDGDFQGAHVDSYHGPMALVLSLTTTPPHFTGGETLIVKPEVLDGGFWTRIFSPQTGLELTDLVDLVPAPHGQLTVFDPRLPHGVAEVRGTRDPMRGRLVLHGWFNEPALVIVEGGGLSDEQEDQVTAALDAALEPVFETLQQLPQVMGLLTAQITVRGGDGSVASVTFSADTLVVPPQALGGELLDAATVRGAVQHTVRDGLLAAQLPAAAAAGEGGGGGADTRIVLPLLFE